MRVTVLYDNSAREGYAADWGFACLLEDREAVLFDTGESPDVLAANMEEAGVDPGAIDKVVLSHDHHDHTGGLPFVLSQNAAVQVMLLPSFGRAVRRAAKRRGKVLEVAAPQAVAPGLYSTGPVQNRIDEQAVWFETDRGLVLVTGCAHPGLDVLLARLPAGAHVHAVLGGFHGFDRLDALDGIDLIGPCHCTQHTGEIAERFPDAFRTVAAGDAMEFGDPAGRAGRG
jgi:7,8-dihydropterin-6-yl-methyl-4-(beta-D-ribofuranosyl)aminobenzene 5'-phosphate synthase